MTIPKILSIGPPPERHAERVVDEMINFMRKFQLRVARQGEALDLDKMGGERGQRKCVKKLLDSIAPVVLGWHLETAKRGRFELQVTVWHAWDANRGELLQAEGPLPPSACLVAYALMLTGVNYTPRWRGAPLLAISRHACIRLAMRAGVRTVVDLIEAMRELWLAFHTPMMDGQESVNLWRIPFKFRDDEVVAVVTRHQNDDRRFVVKTVLDADMVAPLALLPTTQEKSISANNTL